MIKNRQTAEHYKWGQACESWRLLDRPDLTVIQERMPPGEAEVKHFHRRSRQLFYVLEGHVRIDMGDEVLTLGPGDSLEVPPEREHRVHNVSPEPVSLLVISSPSTHADREENEPLGAAKKS